MSSQILSDKDQIVREHYRAVAEKYGASPQSTMEDDVVREKEIQQILNFVTALEKLDGEKPLRIVDLGCGNGYALSALVKTHSKHTYYGTDLSEELLAIARDRELAGCVLKQADARLLPFEAGYFDVVYTERCLINILNWEEQKKALSEIARVLRPGGYYLAIECFTDGLLNNNKARRECGLDEIPVAYHNRYFDKELFFSAVADWFTIIEPEQLSKASSTRDLLPYNFLSSHYFIARVLHPLVTSGPGLKNTEFVKFFSFLSPAGNYSPIQSYFMQRI